MAPTRATRGEVMTVGRMNDAPDVWMIVYGGLALKMLKTSMNRNAVPLNRTPFSPRTSKMTMFGGREPGAGEGLRR